MPEKKTRPAPSGDAVVAAARAVARLSRRIEVALAEVDLSLPQYRVLAFLANGESRPSHIAPNVNVSRPTVTALVDGLVTRGLVDRQPDEADRRRVRHRVTPAGKRALAEADRVVDADLRALAAHLPAERAAAAIDALTWWHEAIDHALEIAAGRVPALTTTPREGTR